MGSTGRTMSGTITSLLQQASSGQIVTNAAEVQDIQSNLYGIDVTKLSASDQQELADIVYDSVVTSGAQARNSLNTVQDINSRRTANINISQMPADDLRKLVHILENVHTLASNFAIQDALKLISWYNQ